MHYISNASSIQLFNILYVFAFFKIMYYECWNKQFELNYPGHKKVIIKHLDVALERDHSTSNDPLQSNVNGLTAPSPTKCIQKKRVAILISGSGKVC